MITRDPGRFTSIFTITVQSNSHSAQKNRSRLAASWLHTFGLNTDDYSLLVGINNARTCARLHGQNASATYWQGGKARQSSVSGVGSGPHSGWGEGGGGPPLKRKANLQMASAILT